VANRVFQIDRSNPHWQDVQLRMNQHIVAETQAGRVLRVTIGEPKRSHEQNDRMWAMLTEISEQMQWCVDGKMQQLSAEEWKDILTAGLKREQKVAQGIDGGFVILGQRTSKMTKREMSDLMELIAAFGSERGVTFSAQ
jgi:hypothetical protein